MNLSCYILELLNMSLLVGYSLGLEFSYIHTLSLREEEAARRSIAKRKLLQMHLLITCLEIVVAKGGLQMYFNAS